MKKLLMGNEAIALGAIRAGVGLVAGYPGTPSTETLETVAKYKPDGIYVEWSVNEKAAMEVAAGAAYAGVRTMVTMKQVGLNVASDPLMSLAYVGVKGGMVVLVGGRPGTDLVADRTGYPPLRAVFKAACVRPGLAGRSLPDDCRRVRAFRSGWAHRCCSAQLPASVMAVPRSKWRNSAAV